MIDHFPVIFIGDTGHMTYVRWITANRAFFCQTVYYDPTSKEVTPELTAFSISGFILPAFLGTIESFTLTEKVTDLRNLERSLQGAGECVRSVLSRSFSLLETFYIKSSFFK